MEWWGNFLHAAVIAGTPLLFATLGGIMTERSGHLNLGIEGMMLMGAVIGFATGVGTHSFVLAMLCAAIAGATGALIYAVLTVTLRTNHVVTGLTLTIFGSGFANFMGSRYIGQTMPENIKAVFRPIAIPLLKEIPLVGKVLFTHDLFVYFGMILAILLGIYLYHTRFGLNLRMVGENPGAADAAGISVSCYRYVHVLIGGALCGLGGAYLSVVYVPSWTENITAGRGWIAVALVIFSVWNPYKGLAAAFFFGGLSIIGLRLQSFDLKISQYLLDMLPYVATIIALIISSMKKSMENRPPKALGTSYFREER